MTTIGLGKRVENHYIWIENGNVLICDVNGICVASSDPDQIGVKILDLRKISLSHRFVNLGSNFGTVLVLNKTDILNRQNFDLYKGLANFAMGQYFENKKISDDSFDRFIAKLVHSSSEQVKNIQYESEAKSLGLNFELKRIAIILYFKDFQKKMLTENQYGLDTNEIIQKFKREIATTINGFFTRSNNMLLAYVGEGKFVIFKSIAENEEERFINLLKKAFNNIFRPLENSRYGSLLVGYGNAHPALTGLLEAFKEASWALEIGQKIGKKTEGGYYFNDFSELRILTEDDNNKKVSYADQVIGRLNFNLPLKKTLEVFFKEDLSVTKTALKLGLHPNTIIYRLKKIKETLGLDPRIFDEASAIKIALLTSKLLS